MRRNTFLVAYVAGLLFALARNPWTALDRAAFQSVPLGLADGIALAAPVALILLAIARERTTGQDGLYLWPSTALLVSGLPFLAAWSQLAAGIPLPPDAMVLLQLVSVAVPLLLHVVCCVHGASAPREQDARQAGTARVL